MHPERRAHLSARARSVAPDRSARVPTVARRARPLPRPQQPVVRHHAHDLPAVPGLGAYVVDGANFLRGQLGCLGRQLGRERLPGQVRFGPGRAPGWAPTEPNASRAATTRPPSRSSEHAALALAISAATRPIFRNALPSVLRTRASLSSAGPRKDRFAVMISPGCSACAWPDEEPPEWHPCPCRAARTACTLTHRETSSAGAVSAAGEALPRFPPSVPMLSTCRVLNESHASASAGKWERTGGWPAISAIVVSAPISRPVRHRLRCRSGPNPSKAHQMLVRARARSSCERARRCHPPLAGHRELRSSSDASARVAGSW